MVNRVNENRSYNKHEFRPATRWDNIKIQSDMSLKYQPSDDNDKKLLAFKYMPVNRLIDNIKQNEVVFVNPKKWRDTFETVFYRDKVKINSSFYEVKALCLTMNDFENEEGLWHFSPFCSSSSDNNPIVRVSYDMDELYHALNKFAQESSCVFYVGAVTYIETQKILDLKNKEIDSIEDYVSRMLLKRLAFEYEKEVRLFYVKEISENDYNTKDNEILKINVDGNYVHAKVDLPPIDPLVDGKHLCKHCYHTLLESSNKEIAEILKKEKIKVDYSRLYDIRYYEPSN